MKTHPDNHELPPHSTSSLLSRKPPAVIIIISILAGLFVWLIDAILDFLVFYPQELTFMQALFTDVPVHDFYGRIFVLVLFIIFGLVVSFHLNSRIKTEKVLVRNEISLRTTLRSIGDGVIATTTNGLIKSMNPVAENLTGYKEADAIGKHINEVFHLKDENHQEQEFNGWERLLQHDQITELPRNPIIESKSGKQIPVLVNASPHFDDSGNIEGIILVFKDHTEERFAKRLLETRLSLIEFSSGHSVNEILEHALSEVCKLSRGLAVFFISDRQKNIPTVVHSCSSELSSNQLNHSADILFDEINESNILNKTRETRKPELFDFTSAADLFNMVKKILVIPVIRKNTVVSLLGIAGIDFDYKSKLTDEVSHIADLMWGIIQEKQTEDQLKESESKYRNLFKSANDAIYIIEGETFTDCNEATVEMFGCAEASDFTGHSPWDFSPQYQPDGRSSRQKAIEVINAAIRDKEHIFYWQHKKKNGQLFDAEISLNQFSIHGKNYLQAIARDISESKRTEDSLRESEERYRLLAETTPDLILLLDFKGNLKYVNQSCQEKTGYTEEELLGTNIVERVTPRFHSHMVEKLAERQSNVSGTFKYHTGLKHKNGNEIPVELYSTPLITENKISEILVVAHDISDRIKSESDLILAKEKAEESDRLKTAFLANMSHEIRTPMNGILGFIQLMQAPGLSDEQFDSYINYVRKSSDRLINTINDIIEISKIEAGEFSVTHDKIDVHEMLHYLFGFFNPEAQQKDLTLKLSLNVTHDKFIIYADKHKLESILTNFIKNAIKFTQAGNIEIGYKIADDQIQFYVKDTGTGIAHEKIQAIFDRFVQGHLSISRPYEGSGLGLPIARGYAKMLNGDIWVDSEIDKGSTFWFSMPLSENVSPYAGEGYEKAKSKPSREVKILVAEDDDASYYYIDALLTRYNYKLLRATNGEKAVEIFHRNPDVSLILMDIEMPLMNGYEATRRIRKSDNKVPIVAQTAYIFTENRDKALEAGCNEFLTKPVDKNKMIETVHNYLKI